MTRPHEQRYHCPVLLPFGQTGASSAALSSAVGQRFTLWLGVGALAITIFIFATPPTPFDALDYRSILLPYLTYYRDSLAAGEFPFWNPYASLGRPFAADPQTVVFWPPVLIYLGLGPFWGAIGLAWLHTWFALWSSAGLCLRLGATRLPALLSGLVFVLSGKIIGHYQAGHLQFIFSYLYLPSLLHAALLVQEQADRRAIALLGALSGWQLLAGAPQVYWSCALALAFFLAGRRLGEPLPALVRGLARDGWRVAAAYGLGLALAAVLLGPAIELISQSNRAIARPEFVAVGSMGWLHWASALTPWTAHDYTVDWELLLYPGLAVTLLGLAGLLRQGDRTVRSLRFMLFVLGILAAGNHTPFFQSLFNWLPGYASFRVHGRLGSVLVYALVLSAVLLVSGRSAPRRTLGRLAVAAVLCAGCLLALAWWPKADVTRPLISLAIAAATAALWFSTARVWLRHVAGTLLVAALFADLLITDVQLKRIFITSQDYALEAPLVAALRETGRLAPGQPPPRVFAPPRRVRANAGMIYGFATIAGSEALALQRVWSYVHWAVGREPPPTSDIYGFEALAARGHSPIPWVAQSAVIDLPARQIEITPLPPRAWIAGRTRLVADWREGAGRLAAGHDPRQIALLETPLPDIIETMSSVDARPVRWRAFSRNRIELETSTTSPGVLTLAEAWYPGWSARVNGVPAAVFPVNGWMRGVIAPAGNARIELFYSPNYFAACVVVSLATLGILFWLGRPFKRSPGTGRD